MSPAGRYIETYKGADGDWRWRVIGANRQDIVADSSEGYENRKDMLAIAAQLFPGLPVDPEPSAGGAGVGKHP